MFKHVHTYLRVCGRVFLPFYVVRGKMIKNSRFCPPLQSHWLNQIPMMPRKNQNEVCILLCNVKIRTANFRMGHPPMLKTIVKSSEVGIL